MDTSAHASSFSIVGRAARRVSRVARHPANNALVQALLAKCVYSLRGTTTENCSERFPSSSLPSSQPISATFSIARAPSCADSSRFLRAARFASQHAFPIADSLPLLEDLRAAKESGHFLAEDGAKAMSHQTSLPFDVLEAAVELYTECPFLLVRDWRAPSFSSFPPSCSQKALTAITPTESEVKCSTPPLNASPKSKRPESCRGGPLLCNFAPSRTLLSAREAEFIFEQIREVVRDHLEVSHESRFSDRGRIRGGDLSTSLRPSRSCDVQKKDLAPSQPLLDSKAAVMDKVAWAHNVKLSPIGANLRGKLFTPDLHILMTHSGVTKDAVRNRRARTNEGHDARVFILPPIKTKTVAIGRGGGVPENEVKSTLCGDEEVADEVKSPDTFQGTRRFGGLALGEVAEGEEEDESITVEALNVILFKVARALELSGVAQKETIVHSNLPDTVSMKLKTFPRRAPSLTQYYCREDDLSFIPHARSMGLSKDTTNSKEVTSERKASSFFHGDSSRLSQSASTLTPNKAAFDDHREDDVHRQVVEFPSRTVYLHVVPWCLYPARLALLSCEMDKAEINADKRKGGCAHYRVNEASNVCRTPSRRHVRQHSWFGPTASLCGSLKSCHGSPVTLGEACATALANLELTAEASGLNISYERGFAPKE